MSAKTPKCSSSSLGIRDPSTNLHRPTSAKTPDVSHILTSVFGELFTKDLLTTDVIKNLTVSSDVDDDYHRSYVNKLKEAQVIKETRLQEYAMLEKHILEAKAKALALEDRETMRRNKICSNPDLYGVPTVKSFYSYCLDDTLLKEHGLLVPSDYYYKPKTPPLPAPKMESSKTYLQETTASKVRRSKRPLDNNNATNVLPPIINASKQSNTSTVNQQQPPHDQQIPIHIDDEIDDELHKSAESDESQDDNNMDILMNYIPKSDGSANEDDDTNNATTTRLDPFWKNALRQEERLNERSQLRKLNERTSFLPNPRLFAARTAQFNDNPEVVFEVAPKFILFDRYTIGKVFESSFEVRNISTIAHQFRAIPPKTQYFSLSLGQYPQSQSVIAPGLGALFNVRFVPDSLGSFEDEICIEASNGSVVNIPVIAKRESPCLSIGSIVDCGYALVGQIKGCRFIVENSGGDGRFVVFPKSAWPFTTFKTNLVSSSSLNVHPFELQPSMFDLRKGEAFILECVFKPPDDKRYEQDIVVVCDNCTIRELKLIGQGQLARVEIVDGPQDNEDPSGDLNFVAIDEFKDVLSSRIVRFSHLNPNVFERKKISIKNLSSCPIDFSWANYKPIMQDNLMSMRNSIDSNYAPETNSLFSIAPKQGTFDRDETKNFEILFSPNKVGTFTSVVHLILHGIPEINRQLMMDTRDEIQRRNYLMREDFTASVFVASVVELRGECEPFQFALDPPAILVPGEVYMQSTSRKSFRLINMSPNPINFRWKQVLEPHIIQVEPSYGEISPKSYALMDVLITGVKPGKLADDISCFVEYAEQPVVLHVEANIKGPEAVIQEAGLDFGLVKLGEVGQSFVMLDNISNLPLNWSLVCLDNKDLFEFQSCGSLIPLESRQISIKFIPKEEIVLSTRFEIDIEMGNKIVFNCHGQAQRPAASFIPTEISLDQLYLNVQHEFNFNLCNHSMLEAHFRWGDPEGEDSKNCEIEFDTKEGRLAEKSTYTGTIKIKPYRIGRIEDLKIPCFVRDMAYRLNLSIKGLVKGVSVEFYILNDKNNTPLHIVDNLIDLGRLRCGDSCEKRMLIKNTSAIHTRTRFSVARFRLVALDDKIGGVGNRRRRRYRLDGDELSGFGVRCLTTNDDSYSNGDGEDDQVDLPPYSECTCRLFALGELWGDYDDELSVRVDGVPFDYRLRLVCRVDGAPLRLYTGRMVDDADADDDERRPISGTASDDEIPVVRFGSLVQTATATGAAPIRKLQILNTCHVPVHIEWRVFLTEPDDTQLIDLNLIYPDGQVDAPKEEADFKRPNMSRNESSASFLREKIEPIEEEKIDDNATETNIDSNYLQQFPIIKINLSSHYGREISNSELDKKVFYLNEYKSLLKPREKTALQITFNPNSKFCRTYEATFVGYLKLAQNLIEGCGFSRKIGFEHEPIRFKATGTLESPNLIVEFDNDDLSFRTAIGDLIKIDEFKKKNNFIVEEKLYKNQFSLFNTTTAPVEFSLAIKKPFSIAKPNQKYLIKPKSKLKFDVLFKLDTGLIKKHVVNECTLIHDYITISYPNTSTQFIQMDVKIFAPKIKINTLKLDFGTCLIGQERCQQIYIKNPSFSSLVWTSRIENDTDSVFRCDLTQGLLCADKDFISTDEQTVNVYFTAQSIRTYSSRLVVLVEPTFQGNESIIVELTGDGSVDQKHEAILNI